MLIDNMKCPEQTNPQRENRLVGSQGLRGGENMGSSFMGIDFFIESDENVPDLDSGCGCTT